MAAAITATDRYTFFTERVISLPPRCRPEKEFVDDDDDK
jgi:hypothetical protein